MVVHLGLPAQAKVLVVAVDLRIGTDSLYARVIVAGGGGGGGEDNETGGYGGGETGGTSGSGTPGSQTAPSGYFGIGGHTSYDGGGGGGGWYGADPAGGQTTPATGSSGSDTSGSPGGSGYVYTSATASNYPSGCLLNSSYYLSAAKTIAGNTSFTSPTGSSETGHSGNGYCRITVIECKNTALYTRINNSMKKATAFYFKLNNNKMYGVGSANYNGSVMNFDYTGSVQTVTLAPGTYKLECWGAQGGNGSSNGNSNINAVGGLGGYSVGTITLSKTQKVYIYSGGKGQTKSNTGSYSTVNGGFNGGGSNYTCGSGGSGGGGWYGGQGTYPDGSGDDDGGGGGGSGYVYTSSSASNYPQGCLLNSSYYLSDASNLSGNESFKSPSGSTETGHSDNGYCRITCYIKKKTLHCKMNNEIKKAAPVFMKMNNKIYDAGANAVMDFAYTGTAQAISLPRGQYIIECWGAQGGYRSSSDYGGKGGYSVGTLTLTQSTDLYIYVGGAGNSSTTRLSNNSSIYEGGFNGGGHRYDYKGGGGATDVRIGKDSLYARIIVAGGGGSDGATNKKGMYGGGLKGGSTTESCGSGGYGGTQTGNTWLTTTRSTNASYDTASCYAGFGFGGNGNYASSGYGGAGGGGWYGGSGSYPDGSGDDDRGGGGGSGYVYTAETAVNYPDGNYVNSSYYLTNAQTIAGNQSFKSPDGTNETGHTGNGFCRITRKSGKIFVKQNGSWIKV